MGIVVRREVDDLFQQAVPLGNTVPMDELKDLVPDAELSRPAFNVVTGSYDPRSLKPSLLEFKTMRYGVEYSAVPRATAVDRFERSLLGDKHRGLAARDAAWRSTEPEQKGPLRDIMDMSEYTGMVFGTVVCSAVDVQDKVSDEQAAARLDAITKFRAKVDYLGPTGFPRKFLDLFKEHIVATNTTIRSEAYRIKNQMPDLVISFFTEFALLACAPELLAVSAPNASNELWISMKAKALPVMPKGVEVDKDDKVWLNTELRKTCIVEGDFKAPATKQAVAEAMSAVRAKKATFFIADALFGAGSHTWDSKDAAWGTDDFNDVFAFAGQDTPHNPGA
eukprot:jgi/Tetstr1/442090/TSEL_003173.t1